MNNEKDFIQSYNELKEREKDFLILGQYKCYKIFLMQK